MEQILQDKTYEIKFSPTNSNVLGVLTSRDIQFFELRKEFQPHKQAQCIIIISNRV